MRLAVKTTNVGHRNAGLINTTGFNAVANACQRKSQHIETHAEVTD